MDSGNQYPLAGPSRSSPSTGSWQPLPYIHTGFVVHSYRPASTPPTSPAGSTSHGGGGSASASPRKAAAAHRNRFSWSGHGALGLQRERGKNNVYEIPLDIGDEFFAFEEYRCAVEEDGRGDVWLRGYVVQAVSLATLAPPAAASSSFSPSPSSSALGSSSTSPYPRPEPSVLIGIFPSSCVHVRPGAGTEDPVLSAAYERAVQLAKDRAKSAQYGHSREMEAVKEEDEEGYDLGSAGKAAVNGNGNDDNVGDGDGDGDGGRSGDRADEVVHIAAGEKREPPNSQGPGQAAKANSLSRSNRPRSLVFDGKGVAGIAKEEDKEQPPLPRLTAGDSTIAGTQWPLVDEIACAIREWYSRLATYLANRNYRLFSIVMQHIDALFLGRRQLLAQTLSSDELVRVRRECVSRLVKCNVAQGLEVIVRSLEDGSVMVMSRERAFSGASWIGGITCYVYQVQLAYIDLIPLDDLFGKPTSMIKQARRLTQPKSRLSLTTTTTEHPTSEPTTPFHHLLLDFRAFVASPCVPGEIAELYFALYNKAESRFVTEEFCLILNHLGSPARDGEQRLGRLRTLFTDLKLDDVSGSIYLVCRMVRNGALKMRNEATAGTLETHHRSGTPRRASGNLAATDSISRGAARSFISDTTDDSFSVTSGFEGHRTTTGDTHATTAPSIIDGRPTFRRPLGCAVIELPVFSKLITEGAEVECTMPIWFAKDEATFATLHEDIIHGRTSHYLSSSRADAIAIALKLYYGVAPQLIREHPSLLADISLSARLGFSDVVFPGAYRNDLYIKLWSASFTTTTASTTGSLRSRKSVVSGAANIQVTLEVRRADGTVVSDAIFAGGSGEPPMAQYHSLVFYHNERPTFGELVKISLHPRSGDCHLFLTFRSRSKDRNSAVDSHELEKPFAFAYLPLFTSSFTLRDGSHDLVLYRMEKGLQPAPNLYFEVPFVTSTGDSPVSPSTSRTITPLRDRMSLRSYLCSSAHSQDDTLRALLSWPSMLSNVGQISSTLRMFGFVPEEEIAKFVPSIFDSLFGILVSNLGDAQDETDNLVFKALIKVLSMVFDRRFPSFNTVLDIYISRHFSFPASSFRLLRSMKAVMSTPNTKDYRSFLKVWHLFFRFITRSRELDRARGPGLDATSAHIEADFRKQTRGLLGEINTLMLATDKGLIGSQTLAVQHYADILPDLAQVFSPLDIAEIIIAFADTLTRATGGIAIQKLLLLLRVVQSVFDTSDARALLVPAIVRWVKPHLGRYDGAANDDTSRIKWLEASRLAVTVVARVVNKLEEWYCSPLILEDPALRRQEEDNLEYCLSLLPSLLTAYKDLSARSTIEVLSRHQSTSNAYKVTPDVFPSVHPFALVSQLPPPSLLERQAGEDGLITSGTFNTGLAEIAVVVLTLVTASPRFALVRFFNELLDIDGRESTSLTLQAVFDFGKSVISFEAFPKQWLTLSLMCFQGIIKLMDVVAEILENEVFIPKMSEAQSFDASLWSKCLELLCDLCGSDELALEEHTQQRRRAEWIIAGDLRDEGAGLLLKLWNAIGWPADNSRGKSEVRYGGYQTRFTGLAEKVLGLCLSSHDQMCETAVEILFSMIYAEYVLEGKFDGIESEIFAKLEKLFTTRTNISSDPTMRAYFVAQLRAVFERSPEIDATFHQKVGSFLDQVELFIDLLLGLGDLPDGPDWKDERAAALYRLMLFVRQIGRTDLYLRFVHQLVRINIDSGDHVGAGLALRLHADTYEWDTTKLVDEFHQGDISLPAQSEFARKEALYYHAIDHFTGAEAYELTLELCQELTAEHQRITFDVSKLSELLTHQARLWEKIGHSSRAKIDYFRIAFFGDCSPLNKDKDFIVRGRPWQRYSDFCDMIQHKFPTAAIHRSKIPPPESMRTGVDQTIWITPVVPEPDLTRPVFADTVAPGVQEYWRHNGCDRYSSTRPYMVNPAEIDVALTWTEKTLLTTKEPLPGVLARSEVKAIKYEQVSPIENAVQEVVRAAKALRIMSRARPGHPIDAKQLGTAINGAVDSPVSGGVKLYKTVFLDPAYLEKFPKDAARVEELDGAIFDYVRAIQESLSVHRDVCRDLAFHEALKSHFHRAFPDELMKLPRRRSDSIMIPRPLPALPPKPATNGDRASSPTKYGSPRISISESATDAGAAAGAASYTLPPLRLGLTPTPTITPTPTGGAGAQSRVPSVTLSSPQPTITSRSSSSIKASRSSISVVSGGNGDANGVPSLGSRARSLVGTISRRSSSISGVSEGTIDGSISGGGGGAVVDATDEKKPKLSRFGSLMRRK